MNTVADNSPNSKLASALDLVNRGWFVHILRPGMKVPATPNGQKDATQDLATIYDWWGQLPEGNPAVACEPSGLYVIDVDMGMGKVGAESWASLVALHGHVETFTVRTRSGGLHYYYALPEALPGASETPSSPSDRPRMRNSASKLGKDIDTRGNGYVVAPGSVVDGGAYVIELDIPPAPLPEWIRSALAPSQAAPADVEQPHAPATTHFVPASDDEVKARIAVLAEELRTAENGQRNDTAARVAYMAGQYVGAGQLDHDYICAELLKAVEGWPNPDKTRETITRQAREGATNPRAWSATPPPKPASASASAGVSVTDAHQPDTHAGAQIPSGWFSDAKFSEWVASVALRGKFLYSERLDRWFRWDDKRWVELPGIDEVIYTVSTWIRGKFMEEAEAVVKGAGKTLSDGTPLLDAWRKCMSRSKLENVVRLARTYEMVSVDYALLDADPDLLNTPAGVVDLRTGQVFRHDPKYLMTKLTRGSYRPGYTHPDWEAALEALPADVRRYMQLRMGQAATGHTPESDDAVFLNGQGSNGKSLMMNDGIFRAMGDYASFASGNLILKQAGQGGASPERAALRGCRYVLIEEIAESGKLNIKELKDIIGTSTITARFLNQNYTTFEASHSLFINTNYIPGVAETDDGTWRRLCMINFPYRFTTNPTRENDKPGDPWLKQRCRTGQDQHDAMLTWLVEGAIRYYADRSSIMPEYRPAAVQAMTDQWRNECDRVMCYVNERIILDPDAKVARADLLWDFNKWMTGNDQAKWSMETLLKRFLNHAAVVGRISESRTRNHNDLSRPFPTFVLNGMEIAKLPGTVRVISGIRFREDADR